jgi:hypothetical protein
MTWLMEKNLPLVTDNAKFVYYTSKAIATLILLGIAFYAVFLNRDTANLVIQFGATFVYQLLPLLMRFMMTREKPLTTWSVILFFVITIIYLSIIFAVDLLSHKIKKVEKHLTGKIIPVISEESYYDENGRFVSATLKDKENK